MFYIFFTSDLPIIHPPLELKRDGRKIMLSWPLPEHFYTSLAIEECRSSNKCNIHSVSMNATNFETEGEEATYRLVVYQHGQKVAVSQPFVEVFPLHGKGL